MYRQNAVVPADEQHGTLPKLEQGVIAREVGEVTSRVGINLAVEVGLKGRSCNECTLPDRKSVV